MMRHLPTLTVLLAACGSPRTAEDPSSWYSAGEDYDVQETVEFTTTPYDVAGSTAIADIPLPDLDSFSTWFAQEDGLPEAGCSGWTTRSDLPVEITGIVTSHPRWYYKASGCRPEDDFSIDSDEKFYGSYFIEDETGGIFVLGDTKVAHFDLGDKVTLRLRATKELFSYHMVYSHDVVSIERGPFPVYYEEREALTDDDLSRVRRMTGTVGYNGDFGEIQLCIGDVADDDFDDVYEGLTGQDAKGPQIKCVNEGRGFYIALDSELQRRGTEYDIGTELTVTGPIIRGFDENQVPFDEHRIVVTRLGQVEVHEDDAEE